MLSNEELCRKIKSIYPDIGECGIAVKVDFDDAKRMGCGLEEGWAGVENLFGT